MKVIPREQRFVGERMEREREEGHLVKLRKIAGDKWRTFDRTICHAAEGARNYSGQTVYCRNRFLHSHSQMYH